MTKEYIQVISNYYDFCRYQGIVITSNNLMDQDKLSATLRQHYPYFDYWHHPSIDPAPSLDCYITEFCECAFHTPRQGLLIVDPEQWLSRWNLPNQGTFWSRLSGHHAGYPVIVLAKDVIATTQLLETYFKPQSLSSAEARLWVSKYQNLS